MKPLHRAVRRATLLGAIAATLTFIPTFFADDYREWRYRQQGIIVCGPADSGMAAGVWTFIAFAAVFTPTLLLSVGRTRRDVFQSGGDNNAA